MGMGALSLNTEALPAEFLEQGRRKQPSLTVPFNKILT